MKKLLNIGGVETWKEILMAGEGKLQAYMKRQCKLHGVYWRKIKFEGVNGAPDTLIAYAGRVKLIELKNLNGRGVLSAQQRNRIKELHAVGVHAEVVHTKGRIDEIIHEIRSG